MKPIESDDTKRLELLNCLLAELMRHDLPPGAKIACLIEAALQQDASRLRVALLMKQAASLEQSRLIPELKKWQ